MRRLISILAAVATICTMAGCRTSDGSEFNPTLAGYTHFEYVDKFVAGQLPVVRKLLLFDLYLSAESEEERTQIHNEYFYTFRIFEEEGLWHVVSSYTELIIDTGGSLLADEGTTWAFRYADEKYDTDDMPTITNNGTSDETGATRYALHVPSQVDLLLDITPKNTTSEGTKTSLRFDTCISGGGSLTVDYGSNHLNTTVMTFEATEPVHTSDPSISWFNSGTWSIRAVASDFTDLFEARYIGSESVMITCNGISREYCYTNRY